MSPRGLADFQIMKWSSTLYLDNRCVLAKKRWQANAVRRSNSRRQLPRFARPKLKPMTRICGRQGDDGEMIGYHRNGRSKMWSNSSAVNRNRPSAWASAGRYAGNMEVFKIGRARGRNRRPAATRQKSSSIKVPRQSGNTQNRLHHLPTSTWTWKEPPNANDTISGSSHPRLALSPRI